MIQVFLLIIAVEFVGSIRVAQDTGRSESFLPRFTPEERLGAWREKAAEKRYKMLEPSVAESPATYEAFKDLSTTEEENLLLGLDTIALDIGRSDLRETLRDSLRSVLEAFAKRQKHKSGYFQGMNFIVARLLEIGLKEDEAFYAVSYLVDEIQEDYFDEKTPGLTRDIRFIQDLLRHCEVQFKSEVIETKAFAFLPTLTGNVLERTDTMRLWDLIVVYGRRGWLASATAAYGVQCGDTVSGRLLDHIESEKFWKVEIEFVVSSALQVLRSAEDMFDLHTVSPDQRFRMWEENSRSNRRMGEYYMTSNHKSDLTRVDGNEYQLIKHDVAQFGPGSRKDILERILLNFSFRQKHTTMYAQEMMTIAARLLEIGLSEEDVFYNLGYIINHVMVDYHHQEFPGVWRDLEVVKKVLKSCEVKFDPMVVRALASGILLSLGMNLVKKTDVGRLWDMIILHGRRGWLALATALLGVECPDGNRKTQMDVIDAFKSVKNMEVTEITQRALKLVSKVPRLA